MKTQNLKKYISIVVAVATIILSCSHPTTNVGNMKFGSSDIAQTASQNSLSDTANADNILLDSIVHQTIAVKQVAVPNGIYYLPLTAQNQTVSEGNLSDMAFEFYLPDDLGDNESVMLVYDLQGVSDFTSLRRRINDEQVFGGKFVSFSNKFSKQTQEISPKSLKKGKNIVRFQLPDGCNQGFTIKDMRLQIVPNQAFSRVVINQPEQKCYYNTFGYVEGFVVGNEHKVKINGEEIALKNGNFEHIIRKPANSAPEWKAKIEIEENGQITEQYITFKQSVGYDFETGQKVDYQVAKKEVDTDNSFELALNSIKIKGEATSVKEKQTLSITALRSIDMAVVGSDMFNVTAKDAGYRLLPDGTKFEKDIQIAIKYDTTQIKDGYTANDIFTFYYDENLQDWERVQRDSIDLIACVIYSHTDHFTDYISGILKAPELPDVQAYTPTMIKDLQAAHPHTGIGQFSVPEANNKGTANTSMPLWLPAGRNGMQPNLSLSYSSGGGNGWLGQGWDIPFSSIEVETRWGVPLYDHNLETETYLLDGETLVLDTVDNNQKFILKKPTYRRNFEERINDSVRFYRRVEGAFQKIMRYNSSPDTYYFVVTNKDGSKMTYGNSDNSELKDGIGNIGKWNLQKMEDLNGNYVEFIYQTQYADENNHNKGKQIYIKEINYTEHPSAPAKYKINFAIATKYSANNDIVRPDVTSNARKGLLEVNAHLLDRIDVIYNETDTLRQYYFGYKNDVSSQGKTLLSSVLDVDSLFKTDANFADFTKANVYDRNGNRENTTYYPLKYDFSYCNDQIMYDPTPKTITVGNLANKPALQLASAALTGRLSSLTDIGSLGGSSSNSWGIGGAVNVGWGANSFWKTFAVGANYSYDRDKSKAYKTFADLNGDGYPDVLFREGGKLKYALHKINADGTSYFDNNPQEVVFKGQKIDEFNQANTSSHNFGLEGQAGLTFGINYGFSNNNTNIYLSDVDGDGLVDIVNNDNGSIFFNRLDANGRPTFKNMANDKIIVIDSTDMCNTYILNDVGVDNSIFMSNVIDTIVYDSCYTVSSFDCGGTAKDVCEQVTKYVYKSNEPLYTPDIQAVRAWIAPYTGTITINTVAELTKNLHSQRFDNKIFDGVTLSIQKGRTNIFFPSTSTIIRKIGLHLDSSDSIMPSPRYTSDRISVQHGDIIYFRVISNSSKAFDVVSWNPTIQYVANNNGERKVTNDKGQDFNIPESFTTKVVYESFLFESNFDLSTAARDNFTNLGQITDVRFPTDGMVRIVADVQSKDLAQPLTFTSLLPKSQSAKQEHFPAAAAAKNFVLDTIVNVSQGDSMAFSFLNTNIDWKSVDAKISAFYLNLDSALQKNTSLAFKPNKLIQKQHKIVPNPDYKNFRYDVKEDFLLNGKLDSLKMPYDRGNITIVAKINSSGKRISEPINFKVRRYKPNDNIITAAFRQPIINKTFEKNRIIAKTTQISANIDDIEQSESLTFELTSPGQVEWEWIDIDVDVFYTYAETKIKKIDNVTDSISITVPVMDYTDSVQPKYVTIFHPVVHKRSYHYAKQPSKFIPLPKGNYTVLPHINWGTSTRKSNTIRMTIKDENGLLVEHKTFVLDNSGNFPSNSAFVFTNSTSGCFFDYYVDNVELGQAIPLIETAKAGNLHMQSGLYTNYSDGKHTKFENIYRGWTQFGYKPKNKYEEKINENLLNLDYMNNVTKEKLEQDENNTTPIEVDINAVPEIAVETDLEGREAKYNPLTGNFFIMNPDYYKNRYSAYSEVANVYRDTMSNMLVNKTEEEIIEEGFPVAHVTNNEVPKTVRKRVKSKPLSTRAGVSVGNVVSVGGSFSWTRAEMLSDYMDMNGDRFPDIVAEQNVQYSKPQGGLSHKTKDLSEDVGDGAKITVIDKSNNFAVSVNGSAGKSKTTGMKLVSISPKAAKIKVNTQGVSASKSKSGAFDNTNVTWADVNGDGLPDRVVTNDGNLNAYLNLGYSLTPEPISIADAKIRQSSSVSNSSSIGGSFGQALSVINFSDLPDFDVSMSISGGIGVSSSSNQSQLAYFDVNNDGLQDIVIYKNESILPIIDNFDDSGTTNLIDKVRNLAGYVANDDKLYVKYNTGSGFTTAQELTSGALGRSGSNNFSINGNISAGFTIALIKIVGTVSGSYSWGVSTENAQFADFNNDGYPDIITVDEQNPANIKVRYAIPKPVNLLQNIETPTNLNIQIGYEISEHSTPSNPSRSWNMDYCRVVHSLLAGGEGDKDWADKYEYAQLNSFQYHNRKYNRFERDDYGYQQVITEMHNNDNAAAEWVALGLQSMDEDVPPLIRKGDVPVTRVVENIYDIQNYLSKGLKLRTTLKNAAGNKFFTREIYNYFPKEISTGDSIDRDNAHCMGDAYLPLSTAFTQYFDGDTLPKITTKTDFTHSRYGNVKSFKEFNTSTTSPDIYSTDTISYHKNLAKYIVGVVENIKYGVKDNGFVYSKQSKIDDKGRITQLTYNNLQDIDLQYDIYGNVDTVRHPANGEGKRKWIKYIYDGVTHTLPIEVTDTLGYSSSTEYDLGRQLPIKTIDVGGSEMKYFYDSRGRIEEVVSPKDDPHYTIKYKYWNSMPKAEQTDVISLSACVEQWVKTLHYNADNPAKDIEVHTVADAFGNITYIKKNVVIDGVDTAVYSGYTIYDYFGQPVIQLSQSLLSDKPFRRGYENGSIYYHFLGGFINEGKHLLTTHKYDVWGRETKTTLPDSTQINTAYAIDSSLFKTSVTDALNQTSNVWKDVRGLQVKIQSPLGITDNYLTRFLYDGIGLLKQTTDPEGHPTTFNYDVLGRTLSIDHPSRGLTFYTYDGATPNVKTETNAKHEVTSFDYDILGRPTHKHFSVNPQNDVYYQYGESTDGLNAGKLTKMQDATGVSEFEYGNMGEVTAQNRMHILPNKSWLTHRTEWYYDSWGRTKIIFYPDGEKVGYFYNNAGNLNKVHSGINGDYISNIKYNKNEQKTNVEYGNGTYALYKYDTVMQRLLSYDLQNSSKKLMRKDYHYNQIGNIDILNSNYQDVGISISENYKYDKDNRLIEAKGNNGGAYKLNMEYSRAGSVLSKYSSYTQILNGSTSTRSVLKSYKYNTPNNPYAVSVAIGSSADYEFVWDKKGCLEYYGFKSGHHSYYTEDNRKQAYLSDKGDVAFYRYDASGERDLKLVGTSEDLNVNGRPVKTHIFKNAVLNASPLMTVERRGYVKHYFAGTERILANVAGKGTPLISTRAEINSISEENAGNLSLEFTTFVEDYFIEHSDRRQVMPEVGYSQLETNVLTKDFENALGANKPDKLYYFNGNHLGSGSLITDGSGNTYQTLAHAPLGNTLVNVTAGSDYSTPYQFTGYEKDEETGYDYAHDRYYIGGTDDHLPPIFDTPDIKWAKIPHLNTYLYCEGDFVNAIDPDGKEKIIGLNTNVTDEEDNTNIVNSAISFKDNGNAIHIWAHGNSGSMRIVVNNNEEYKISNGPEFDKFLSEYSKVWQNKKEGEQVTIVLHSCSTGKGGVKSLAAKLSAELKNTKIIAPDKILNATTDSNGDSWERPYDMEKYNGYGGEVRKKGNWVEYNNGKNTKKYSYNWDANIKKQNEKKGFFENIKEFVKSIFE